jgi:hypothetical protein
LIIPLREPGLGTPTLEWPQTREWSARRTYAWATPQVTRRNPGSQLARQVAADLATRGWRLDRVMSDNASEFRSATFQATVAKLGARLPSFGPFVHDDQLRRYLRSHNTERAHTGRWTKPHPEAVLRKAKL